ncbi:MAG: SUMF1/EgtB/PvdO family nonheme iron enzyme [Opitutales bacterium]|nr:SUMF1/EgtB/PvdO family nonheme iron enzyme [Opitutales bacterium]
MPVFAQEWVVVDTFAGGAPQGSWTFSSGFAREVRSSDAGNYLFVTSATGNTERASVVLPQTVSSGKVTIAFDFFAPGGRSLNQVGFGAGSAAMVARGAWAGVGLQNRFQMVDRTPGATEFLDKIPQFLAKVGVASGDVEWTIDILEPTLQGVWYNIWVVYDLDGMEVSLFARRANADTEDAVHRGTWDLAGATVAEDFAEISRFALGAGGSGNTDAPALGGQFANFYMAVGENLNLTPTAIVLDPHSWQAVDTFAGAIPHATWEGDLEKFDLDFSGGYLHMLPTAQTGSPRGESIYTALPEEVEFGVFTVTFDFLINAPSTSRSDVSFAAVGTAQLESTDNWVRRGGNTRLGTFGAAPQAFRAFSPASTIAIPGAEVAEQWYHAWVVYNLAQRRIDFHYAPFGAAAPSGEPAASWAFDAGVDYRNFTHFIVGLDRPTSTGLRLGNLYFVADELLTLSPTAGTFGPSTEPHLITSHPADVTVAETGTAVFSVGVNGPAEVSYRWQSSFDGGESFANLPDGGFFGATLSGAFTETLTVSSAPLMLDGMVFRVRVTAGDSEVFSDPATLSVVPASPPVFFTLPVSRTVEELSSAQFTVSVGGQPEPALRWQVSTDGGASFADLSEGAPYSGVQTASLMVLPVTLEMDGHRFRAVAQNSAGNAQSASALLTVAPLPSLPVFMIEPEDQTVADGAQVIFSAAASGQPLPTFQWQISIDGGFSYSNITDGSFGGNLFRDTQTADLRILSASPFVDGAFFRVRATNSSGVVFSRGAQLNTFTILSLDAWLAGAGVPADQRGPGDRHGPLQLTNLEAYGMGLLPFVASAEDLPRVERAGDGSNVLRFHYRVNTRAEDVPVSIEESTDLVSWVPAVPVEDRVIWAVDGVEVREAIFGGAETRFLRLRVGETAPSAPGDMVLVEGGTLAMSMGTVTVDSFYMGIYEVTWGEWKAVRAWGEANGYGWYEGYDGVPGGCADDHPVYNINWFDALKWSNAKSEMEGLTPVYTVDGAIYRTGERSSGISQNLSADGYRLPLEAEWEFAARGGNQTHGYTYAGSNDLNAVGWFNGNSGGAACDLWEGLGTWPVGQKLPNELGLHDMSGNVAEWCWDGDFFDRRLRGGSWRSSAFNATVSNHSLNRPDRRWPDLGFRLVRTP